MDVDELVEGLAQSTVTGDNEFGGGSSAGGDNDADAAQHPRFGRHYKNEGKMAELQRQRREDHLERQKSARDEWLMLRRAIDTEEESDTSRARRSRRASAQHQRNPYKNMLMFSDWLVDIPCTLSTEWTLLPSPTGRRALVVANKGETRVYFKNGHLATHFYSPLPGGCTITQGSLTILDVIFDAPKKKLYMLDLLFWNKIMYTDMEFTARQAILCSRVGDMNTEMADEKSKGSACKYAFVLLPSCAGSAEEIGQFMRTAFPFRLDGLLFYYNSAFYNPGQTPLVGWLKPWMLPELLGVPVPEHYTKDVVHGSSREFIDAFNKEKNYVSSTEQCLRKAEWSQMSVDEMEASVWGAGGGQQQQQQTGEATMADDQQHGNADDVKNEQQQQQ